LGIRQLYTWYFPAHALTVDVNTNSMASMAIAGASARPAGVVAARVDAALECFVVNILRFLSDWAGGRAALDMHVAGGPHITPLSIGYRYVCLTATMLGMRNLRILKIDGCSVWFHPPVIDAELRRAHRAARDARR
jgi:hypothetical protein